MAQTMMAVHIDLKLIWRECLSALHLMQLFVCHACCMLFGQTCLVSGLRPEVSSLADDCALMQAQLINVNR